MEMMKLQLKLDDPSAAGLIEWWIENVAPKNLLRTDNAMQVFRKGLREHGIVSITVLNAILSTHSQELDYRGATTVEKTVEVERKKTAAELAEEHRRQVELQGYDTHRKTEFDRPEAPVTRSLEDLRAVANKNPDRQVVAKLVREYTYEHNSRPVLSVTNFRKDLLGRIVVEDSNGIVNWTKTRKAVETKIKEFTRDYSKAIKEVTDAEQKRVAEVKSQRPVEPTVVEEEEAPVIDYGPLPAVPRGCPAPTSLSEVREMGDAYGRAMTATWGKQFEARVNEIIRRSGARTLPMQQFLR